jgi:hypothetical protein
MKTDALLCSRRAFTNRAHPGLLAVSIVSVAACSGAAAAADGTTLVDASYGQPVKQTTSTTAAGSKAAASNELYLVNNTKAKLNVELSDKADSGWKTHSLDKGATLTDAKLRYIRIGTLRGKENRVKVYDLHGDQQRYKLVWNSKHNCYDVWRDQAQTAQTQTQMAQAQPQSQPQQPVKIAQRQ